MMHEIGPLINLKPRLDEAGVRELLAMSMGNPAPERIEQVCQRYRDDLAWMLMGKEIEGELVGCVGVEISGDEGVLHCIAVKPEARRQCLGRQMLDELGARLELAKLSAETDCEAVDFYRRCGFQVESLGEKYPEVERFRCTRWFE